jgi:tetratricopeptide (TPR) repeat protein
MAEAAGDQLGLAHAQSRVGLIHLRQGDPERALPWLERSLDGSQRFDSEVASLLAAGPLGEARAACGATGEAIALLEQAAERATSIGVVSPLPGILGALGDAYLLAGRLGKAQHTAERMLQLTRAQGQRHDEADALRILGEVHARATPVKAGRAEASYREALGIAEQIGTPPLAARCHLGLGMLYRATDQPESAKKHLATAATMFRDMDMRSWLEKAKAPMDDGPR